jgi:glutaredoxin
VKEFLSERGIEYTERDVALDDDAMAELDVLGVWTTPVTVINSEIVVGFDQLKLERLLE